MLRLPREAFDGEALKSFAAGPSMEIVTLEKHWLLTWSLSDSEDYDRFGRDAYSLSADVAGFQRGLELFMVQHSRRPTLVARLVKAGLCLRH
jgi:hypothetical protein